MQAAKSDKNSSKYSLVCECGCFNFQNWYLSVSCLSEQKMPEGSWKCEKCNNINYPFRTKCNRQNCGAEKPAETKESLSPAAEENDQVCSVLHCSCIILCPLKLCIFFNNFCSCYKIEESNYLYVKSKFLQRRISSNSCLSLLCLLYKHIDVNCHFFFLFCIH